MSAPTLARHRVLTLVPLTLVALFAWWATHSSGSDAAPAPRAAVSTAQAGRISFESLPGGTTTTLPLRSFGAGGSTTATVGGSGVGKFDAADVSAVVDAAGVDPLLLRAVATGTHLEKVTVTLFRPGTAKRQEVWQFADVLVGGVRTSQSGSAKAPRVTIGLRYGQVTETTYDAQGKGARSYCFDVTANSAC